MPQPMHEHLLRAAKVFQFVALLAAWYFIYRAALDLFPGQRATVGDTTDFDPSQDPLGFVATLRIQGGLRWWVVMAALMTTSGACWGISRLFRRRASAAASPHMLPHNPPR